MAYQTIPPTAGGTVSVSSPLSGDGSSGSPLTLDGYPPPDVLWRTRAASRVAVIDSTLEQCWSSDFENITSDLVLGTAAGTGTADLESTTNGGSIIFTTGATNNSSRVANARDATVTSPAVRYVSNSRTQKWLLYSRAQIVAAPTLSGQVVLPGGAMQDGTNDSYIGVIAATSTVNWVMKVGAGVTDLGAAFDLNVHDFALYNDGTDVHAYIDWTATGATAAAAGIAAAAGYQRWFAFNATTGANVSFRVFRSALYVVEP
jgi:hypothetical protein